MRRRTGLLSRLAAGLLPAVQLTLGLAGPAVLSAQSNLDRARALLRQADSSLGRETQSAAQNTLRVSRQALTLYGRTAPSWMLGRPNAFIAQAFIQVGFPDSALHYVRRALRYLKGGEDPHALALLHGDVARIHLEAGRNDSALVHLRRGIAMYRQSNGEYGSPAFFIRLAVTFSRLEFHDSVRVALREAAVEGLKVKDPFVVATAFRLWGRSCAKRPKSRWS